MSVMMMATSPGTRKYRLLTSGLNQIRCSIATGCSSSAPACLACCSSHACQAPRTYPSTRRAVLASTPSTMSWTRAPSGRFRRRAKSPRKSTIALTSPASRARSALARSAITCGRNQAELSKAPRKLAESSVGCSATKAMGTARASSETPYPNRKRSSSGSRKAIPMLLGSRRTCSPSLRMRASTRRLRVPGGGAGVLMRAGPAFRTPGPRRRPPASGRAAPASGSAPSAPRGSPPPLRDRRTRPPCGRSTPPPP